MIIAGTGHRPNKLGGYGQAATFRLYNTAVGVLEDLQPTKVISGMALGWDQALALAALNNEVPYIAAVPFMGQESVWPAQSQEQFRHLIKHAEELVVVCTGAYAGWKMQKRNQWMVDHCDKVIALWDGTAGGTANCVRYANTKGKEIINYYDKWKE